MKKLLLIPAVTAASIAVSGCGWLTGEHGVFRDRGDDYRRARVEKPLQLPPELSQAEGDQDFAIPTLQHSAALEGTFEVPRPQSLDGDPTADQVKIRQLGASTWILVDAPPGEVWPRVRQFLNTNQLVVARADATDGLLETGWLLPRGDSAARERYRFRIEQGIQRGSSEVYVLQAGAVAGDKWPASSSDPAREVEMIKALSQFIADNGSTGAVSMLAARGIEAKGKVFLIKQPGETAYLRLDLPSDRAWAALTLALPKAGFTVEDSNSDTRECIVRYTPPVDPEDKPGLWSRFWSWVFGDYEQLDDPKVMYRLHMQTVGSGDSSMRIDLSRQDGKASATGVEQDLLSRIKNKLS